jgi:hypothetical protein
MGQTGMWWRRLSLLALLLAPAVCFGQGSYSTVISSPEPLPNCAPATQGQLQPIIWDVTSSQLKYCSATNTWTTFSLPSFPVAPVGVGQVLIYVPTGPSLQFVLPGITGRSITGACGGGDTILATDANNRPQYVITATCAVSLPTPGSLAVPFASIKFVNDSAANNITITPAGGWTISIGNGALNASTTITPNGWLVCNVDPRNNSNWSCDAPSTGVTSFSGDGSLLSNSGSTGSVTATLGSTSAHFIFGNHTGSSGVGTYAALTTSDLPAAMTQTIANGTSAMGTSAISSGTCATVVTTSATGAGTTDIIIYTANADPTAVTGYGPSASGSLYIWAYPTANNVNFRVCNNTGGTITPSALTLNWRVVR